MPLKGEAVKSLQEIGLITQQPLGVGAGRVEFSGISAAPSTSQASAKSRSVQENPKAALTLELGETGRAVGVGRNQWPQNIDLELVTSCHFIQWQQSPEISLGSPGTELREARSFSLERFGLERSQLQILRPALTPSLCLGLSILLLC